MTKPNIAVILFPGNNCENETARAIRAVGMDADIVRWNQRDKLGNYGGYVLVGGWAHEDRIRAGAIAAKDPIIRKIKAESRKGKPVLGICNGAQVLIESGLVPGLKDEVEMALAPNTNPFVSGYYCTWIKIKNIEGNVSIFTKALEPGEVIRIPIAHGEGRFTTREDGLLKELIRNNQIAFRYCNKIGEIIDKFPVNPNGSMHCIAGICNKKGNVMAMMPHPERATWFRQHPNVWSGTFEDKEKLAPASKIFVSMKKYIESR